MNIWKSKKVTVQVEGSINAILPATYEIVPPMTAPTTFPASNVTLGDIGSRFTATEVETALQEIAGSGRTTETVKANKTLIDTLNSQMADNATVYASDFKTGSNDWGEAINLAIDSITSGTVLLPAGELEYTHSILQKSNVTIEGQGIDSTILEPTDCHGITVTLNAYLRFANIRNLTIKGNNGGDYSTYSATKHGINWNTGNVECYQCEVYNVRIYNCYGKGLYAPYDFSNKYERVYCSHNGGHAIEICGLNTCTLRNCYVDYVPDTKVGYRIYNHAILDSCNGMGGNGDYWGCFGRQNGYLEDSDNGVMQYYITMINCNIEDFAVTGLRFVYTGGFNLNNCHFYAPDAGTFEYYINAEDISVESFIDGVSTAQSKGATLAYASGYRCATTTPAIVSYGLMDTYTTDGTVVVNMPLIRSGIYEYLQNVLEFDYMNIKGMTYYYLGAKKHTHGTAAPGSGTWAVGDIVYNTSPAPSGFIGWVCTSSGTPGTWKGFGAIEA